MEIKFQISKLRSPTLILPISAMIVDCAYLPNAQDPLNPVKFWILGFLSIYCISKLFSRKSIYKDSSSAKQIRIFFILILIFSGFLFLSFIFTDVKSIGLVGFTGRNNGLLSYFFLSIIFIYAFLSIKVEELTKLYLVISIGCLVFSIYGLVQHFNFDPIKWSNPYNHIILLVGNPDFASALLGLFATIIFSVLFTDTSWQLKIFILLLFLFTIIIIYWSQALQGLIASSVGVGLIITAALWQRNSRAGIVFLLTEVVAGITAVFGMMKIGPLSHYLYKASVNDRGYDWRAAWHMFTSHPWFGVGLDRYAAYFHEYRDSSYPLIYGYKQSVNNSHNVFLELLATGGIFVGITYCALIGFIAWRAFVAWKIYKDSQQILVVGVIAGWVVFVSQSVISVDNLSISIWGWILGGLIVGLSKPKIFAPDYQGTKVKSSSFKVILIFTILSLLFLKIAVPMYQSEIRMRTFQQIQPPTAVAGKVVYEQIADKTFHTKLLSPDYKIFIAFSMTNAGYVNQGISYFQQVLKQDPRRYDAYYFLASISEAYKNYLVAIKYRKLAEKINPFDAENLLQLEKDYLANSDRIEAVQVCKRIVAMAGGTDVATQASKLLL